MNTAITAITTDARNALTDSVFLILLSENIFVRKAINRYFVFVFAFEISTPLGESANYIEQLNNTCV